MTGSKGLVPAENALASSANATAPLAASPISGPPPTQPTSSTTTLAAAKVHNHPPSSFLIGPVPSKEDDPGTDGNGVDAGAAHAKEDPLLLPAPLAPPANPTAPPSVAAKASTAKFTLPNSTTASSSSTARHPPIAYNFPSNYATMTTKEKRQWRETQPEFKAARKATRHRPEAKAKAQAYDKAHYKVSYENNKEARDRLNARVRARILRKRLASREAIAALLATHPGYRQRLAPQAVVDAVAAFLYLTGTDLREKVDNNLLYYVYATSVCFCPE